MTEIRWDLDKERELKRTRNITFEQLLNTPLIGVEKNRKRPHQRLMIFKYKGYAWIIPYVSGPGYIFLKTAFPSRKYTQKYLKGGRHDQA